EHVSSPAPVADGPRSLAVDDLDRDGDQDLAVGNFHSDDVTILRNSGLGNFGEPASSAETAGDAPTSLAAADLDGDGDSDLAVANAESDNVTVLRNR
ncbi:MAG TPA: FG-GAP-like repeat-containing protein, partial [Gaiellaceae bacterium]|nr:FG-GAP-like repeat-containing protein [Gaiellaceae bacterium]